jgi:D-alanyl-D-alanine carboxypeptidase/D-alanyl-D-alanine-endopeptidase (penicillin-binding protein 4)
VPTRLLALGFLLFAGASPLASQSLESRVKRLLDRPPLDRHLWGIAVLDARGHPVLERNADRLFIPASNTKLIVTAAATSLFPPEWTVRTSVYPDGALAEGTLSGNLVLYGRGDPTWSRRCFTTDTVPAASCLIDPALPLRTLAGQLRRSGLRRVAGDLVADGTYFEPLHVHPTWENDDLIYSYAAPVSGLGFNENSATVTILPAPTLGAPASISVEPWVPGLDVSGRLLTTTDTSSEPIRWRFAPDDLGWRVDGTVRFGSGPRRMQLAVSDPDRFAGLAFAAVLADSGITLVGTVRVAPDSFATREARTRPPLAEVESRPVSDWIFPILNVSQNWYAEMLLKQLGRQFGTAGSWSAGLLVERRFLIDAVRIDSTQFSLADGSGLSTKNLVTPLAFARLLRFMRLSPRYEVFTRGLPRSGAVGSLQRRFVATPLAGKVMAKTGSIGTVNTLSGYLPCGVFSIQANHHTLGGRAMIDGIDSVVVAIGRRMRCR